MLLRKIFGDNTHYLASLKSIKYGPIMFSTSTPDYVFEESFNNGKKQLLNLLNVIIEDIRLDTAINDPEKTLDKSIANSNNVFIVHGHNEEMKLAVARTLKN